VILLCSFFAARRCWWPSEHVAAHTCSPYRALGPFTARASRETCTRTGEDRTHTSVFIRCSSSSIDRRYFGLQRTAAGDGSRTAVESRGTIRNERWEAQYPGTAGLQSASSAFKHFDKQLTSY
jgi:hypothetical protein